MLPFDPFSEAFYQDPYPIYRRMRDEDPAHYVAEYDTWFLSRFRDIWRVEQMSDALTLREGQMPLQVLGLSSVEMLGQRADNLGFLDPPQHTKLRAVLSPRFRPGAIRELEATTRGFVRGFVDEIVERGEADVVADLAMRTSVRIACTIIGLPLERADWLASLVNTSFERDASGQEHSGRAQQSSADMFEFIAECIALRRRRPNDADDAINSMLHAEIDGKRLPNPTILSNLTLLLVGGTETLPKAFSSGVLRLAEQPDQRAQLVLDPSLVPHAFHEMLRYDMPTQMLGRRVRREIELHGKTLRPGQGLLFMWASANRDEREFPDAERFDIHRRAPRILTFGSGAHMCLGAHVARMEGEVMLEELLRRIPDYEVDVEKAVRVRSEVFRGFASLPIRW